MALIKCAECGHDISDTAASCPSCGAPVSVARPVVPPVDAKPGSNAKPENQALAVVALDALTVTSIHIEHPDAIGLPHV